LQVPNESLMKCDIDNITESDSIMDRIHFEVDAKGVTPDKVHELGHMVQEMMKDGSVQHLYDHHFHPHAAIKSIGNPLKYQVPRSACASLSIWHSIYAVVLYASQCFGICIGVATWLVEAPVN
jgi:hypothetical protein